MASLISGYAYDIFISYRQKDNKGDKWVSKFVDSLKTELEATFKEDVSVYFDENPHDRLQETHNVDKTLEGKLKCVIFIPILSQTYCDPNSYAWQYEFLAFLKLAGQDSFGKDIKLRSGNVASRILPIRIHDLEKEDTKLFEKETGSVLRALDFVFKTSTGVIRPLLPNEDHPNDNLNRTFYRDQICKVTLAIKEIILGMKKEPEQIMKEQEKPKDDRREQGTLIAEISTKQGKRKFLPFVAIVAVLVILVILAYPKILKRNTFEKLRSSGERISVAVMPFQNMTNDTTLNVWQFGIQFNLTTSLSNYSDELKVSQTESINYLLQCKGLTNYASITPSVASMISQNLDAKIFIYGNINEAGDLVRINAQLVDSKTKEVFKSFKIEGTPVNITSIVDTLATRIKDFLFISKISKGLAPDIKHLAYNSTSSPQAYENFINGNYALQKRDFPTARNLFLQSIEYDSTFFFATYLLSATYFSLEIFDQAKYWCKKAYRRREQLSEIDRLKIDFLYSAFFENNLRSIESLEQLKALDDKDPMNLYTLGSNYANIFQYNKAIPELEEALKIYEKWGIKPYWIYIYYWLGLSYHNTGQYEKERQLYKKAEKYFPNDPALISFQAILSLSQGDSIKENTFIKKYLSILSGLSLSEVIIASSLGNIYSEAGILNKAEEYYRRALSLEPNGALRLNALAWFLIDKNRNINEGLELVDRALKQSPENYKYLDTKGWGLYKLGRYNDALEILQKSWDLRMKNAIYDHEAFLHLEAAKKAVAGMTK